MKKFKNLKLSKKTISSLTDLEMSYVKGAYGTGGYSSACPYTPPQSTLCPSAVCNPTSGGNSGSQCSQYGCPTPTPPGYSSNLYGTFTSQGCVGLSTC